MSRCARAIIVALVCLLCYEGQKYIFANNIGCYLSFKILYSEAIKSYTLKMRYNESGNWSNDDVARTRKWKIVYYYEKNVIINIKLSSKKQKAFFMRNCFKNYLSCVIKIKKH